ncbi:polyhydroxyalkanoic acid system family protein [Aquincola sp. MAHUQ-54]|uniref:Polyhydroxyalkanoic acid system family protein n=1 Tax=Aquincola agrisoli TaxID=3119538 RepID=A0AAW9QFN7_9BURK
MARNPDIHIQRTHALGLPQARTLARRWMAQVEEKFGLRCSLVEGEDGDTVRFERTGVKGTLCVTPDGFDLQADLGFLFKPMGATIEAEIARKLDALLAQPT